MTPTWRDAVTLEIEYDTPCNIRQFTNFWYRDSASTELGFYRIVALVLGTSSGARAYSNDRKRMNADSDQE